MKKIISSTLLIAVFAAYAASRAFFGTGVDAAVPPSLGGSFSSAIVPPVSSSPTIASDPPPAASSVAPLPGRNGMGGNGMGMGRMMQSRYRDGTYTGISADAYYGNVQVQVTVQGGNVTDVQFLDHPGGRETSIAINAMAVPALRSEAIQTQQAPVDIVSGATETSGAFNQSFASALAQAQA